MVKLQQRWESTPNVFGDKYQDCAMVDRVALYRLMMTHISTVLRMPRGNRVTRSGGVGKFSDTSQKVITIPGVNQMVSKCCSAPHGRAAGPARAISPPRPGTVGCARGPPW